MDVWIKRPVSVRHSIKVIRNAYVTGEKRRSQTHTLCRRRSRKAGRETHSAKRSTGADGALVFWLVNCRSVRSSSLSKWEHFPSWKRTVPRQKSVNQESRCIVAQSGAYIVYEKRRPPVAYKNAHVLQRNTHSIVGPISSAGIALTINWLANESLLASGTASSRKGKERWNEKSSRFRVRCWSSQSPTVDTLSLFRRPWCCSRRYNLSRNCVDRTICKGRFSHLKGAHPS